MPAPPDKKEISDAYPNPSNGVMRLGMARLYDYAVTLLGATGSASDARTALGAFASSGGNFDGAVNERRATVASHPSTADIWSALGNSINFTGTATVDTFPDAPQAGAKRWLHCAGACKFKHSSLLVLPGGIDFQAAVGDVVFVEALTPSVFKVLVFRNDGKASVESDRSTPEKKQTVLSGPVDVNGYPAFGGAIGSTTVTVSGTLRLTSCNGDVNHTWTRTNPSWTGLSVNGTMYLYDDEIDGQLASSLAPTYRFGGADVTTNGRFTYNIQEAVAKVGNGTAAVQKFRVCVGEVTVSGGVVTAIVWYALQGRYRSGLFASTVSTTYPKSHNLGVLFNRLYVAIADDATGTNYRMAMPYAAIGSLLIGYRRGVQTATSGAIVTASTLDLDVAGGGISSAFHEVIYERGW